MYSIYNTNVYKKKKIIILLKHGTNGFTQNTLKSKIIITW